jgi:hypothetical protein
MTKVFISHASEDKERFVRTFARALIDRGIAAWVDEWEILPGDSLIERIFYGGMDQADAIVAVLSRFSVDKPWVRTELRMATMRHIQESVRVIVIRLDDVAVPPPLSELAWVDINPAMDYTDKLDSIVKALSTQRPMATSATGPVDPVRILKDALASSSVAAQDIVGSATKQTLRELCGSRYTEMPQLPEHELPGAVQQRLMDYEQDMNHLLKLTGTALYFGHDDHDRLWLRALDRVLNQPATGSHDPWLAAESYPALLLTYVIGITALAADRDDILHTQFTRTTRSGESALQALSLRRVVDPYLANNFPEWQGLHQRHAMSTHIRQALEPVMESAMEPFEYTRYFEEFEYVRSLLELHEGPFTSLGEFAPALSSGKSNVIDRMVSRLGPSSTLLRAGAFGGHPQNVEKAVDQLWDTISGRYS